MSARLAREGWLLVVFIILISTVILALAGVTFFLTAHLRTTSLRQNQTKAIYLAQAGVMRALYDFRSSSTPGFLLGEYNSTTGARGAIGSFPTEDVFILGGQAADFLLAAMIPASLVSTNSNPFAGSCAGGTRNRLDSWTLRNVLLSNVAPGGMPIAFNQVIVTWDNPLAGEGVVRLDLNGDGFDWHAPCATPQASGVAITLPSTQTLNSGAFWSSNRMWFVTNTMSSHAWIEMAFVMTDTPASTRRARYLIGNGIGSSGSFTVKSIGEVRKGAFPFTVWRRLQAEYRLNHDDTNVTNLQEIGNLTADPTLWIAPAAPIADQRPGYKELTQRSP